MVTGHVESLKRGFRAVVYAGRDPITGRKTYLKETHPTREAAERARLRLVAQVEAERIPDQATTVAHLLDRWSEVADHELSTRTTNEGYIRRTLKPAIGDIPLRKLQQRVDIIDQLYTRCAGAMPCATGARSSSTSTQKELAPSTAGGRDACRTGASR